MNKIAENKSKPKPAIKSNIKINASKVYQIYIDQFLKNKNNLLSRLKKV